MHCFIQERNTFSHFTREALQSYRISLKYIPTESMTADVMTKSVGKLKHEKRVEMNSVLF